MHIIKEMDKHCIYERVCQNQIDLENVRSGGNRKCSTSFSEVY